MKPFVPIVIVDASIAGEALATKHQLEELITSVNRSSFDIAELLNKVKKRGYYSPFSTFQEYCATLSLKPRKAQYLTRMAGVMEEVGIARSWYEPLGVSRLREITSLEPTDIWTNPVSGQKTAMREFITGFVEYRQENGDFIDLEKLKQNVRTLKGFVGENDFVWFNLFVQRSALESVVRPAFDLMKARIGSVKKDDEGISQDATDSTCLVNMAADYLSDPTNSLDTLHASPEEEIYEDVEDISEVTI